MRAHGAMFVGVFAACVGLAGGCGIDNPGVDPPRAQLNFPTAIALSPSAAGEAPRWLYVASSNFDLRYNAGSLHSFDLDAVAGALRGAGCTAPCALENVDDFMVDEVLIGSHASGLAVSPSGDRLFLAIRSDANLTYVDVDRGSGSLSCEQRGAPARCGDAHRRGDEAVASERGVALPGDPVGVVAGSLADLGQGPDAGDYVLMAHRTGRVSLFLDERSGTGRRPTLVHVVTGLPEGLVNVSLDRASGIAWLTSATEARIGRVAVAIDAETSDLLRSFAYDAGSLAILGVDTAGRGDTRDVVFDPRVGRDRAYVLSRRPEAILVADRAGATPGTLGVTETIPVGFGPSRLVAAELDVTAAGGEPRSRTLLFASCYDARDVWVIDPDLGQPLTVIRGMSGPFELVVDPVRELVLVADFRASVVRVADLGPLLTCLREGMPMTAEGMGPFCEPRLLGTVGKPRPVGELL